jgi:Transcription factor WhiB
MSQDEAPPYGLWGVSPRAAAEWRVLIRSLAVARTVACETGDPAAWWPEAREANAPPARGALEACRRCPAAGPCLSYALAADERFGIWGGTTPADRRAMRWREAEP